MKSRLIITCLLSLGLVFASVGRASSDYKKVIDKDVGLSKIKKEDLKIAAIEFDNYQESIIIMPVLIHSNEITIKPFAGLIKEKLYLLNCSILQFSEGAVAAV